MKAYLALFSLILTAIAFAQGQPVPHEFANGNAVVASEFNANFQELSNRNKNSKDQIDQNTAAIDALETSMDSVQATASQNSTDISTLQTSVSTVQATATQNASDINSVQSLVSTVQGSVSQHTTDIITLNTTIANIDGSVQTSLGTVEGTASQNAADITTLNTDVASIDGTVIQIQADLANLQAGGGAPLLQFVGNSTGIIDGGQGIRTMIELCQVDYPGSRMCETQEYGKTINFPALSTPATAWIMPIIEPGGGGDNTAYFYINYAGILTNDNNVPGLTCEGWKVTTGSGLTVSEIGKMVQELCSAQRPVSCCK